jgi:hypothetical protein
MADTTIGLITLVYRGETQQFSTVSQAIHFLRQERIKVSWFYKIKAAVDLFANGKLRKTHHLKGQKYDIVKSLEQLESAIKPSNA